eukprot:1185598-Prorocentrum_minimum.AAC.2
MSAILPFLRDARAALEGRAVDPRRGPLPAFKGLDPLYPGGGDPHQHQQQQAQPPAGERTYHHH